MLTCLQVCLWSIWSSMVQMKIIMRSKALPTNPYAPSSVGLARTREKVRRSMASIWPNYTPDIPTPVRRCRYIISRVIHTSGSGGCSNICQYRLPFVESHKALRIVHVHEAMYGDTPPVSYENFILPKIWATSDFSLSLIHISEPTRPY